MRPKRRFIDEDPDLWRPAQIVEPEFAVRTEPVEYTPAEWGDLFKPTKDGEPTAYTDSAAETGYTPPPPEDRVAPGKTKEEKEYTPTPAPAPKTEYAPAAAGTPSAAEAAGETPASYEEIVSRVRDNMQRYYDMLDGVGNMRWTGYDVEADELYKQYAAEYARGAEKAMKDAMGRAAILNGGYGSTYAQQVGQQTYQDYMAGLANKIPELYELAYNRFRDERGDALNLANAYRNGALTDYELYSGERSYADSRADKERAYAEEQEAKNAGSYAYYDARRFGDLGLGTEETYEIDDAIADAIESGNFEALSETLNKYGITGTQADRIKNYANRMNALYEEQTAEDYEYQYIDERLLGAKELSYAQKKQLDFDAYMYLMTGDISALQKDFTTFQMGNEALQVLDDLKRQRMLVEQSAASGSASEKQSMSAAELKTWRNDVKNYIKEQKEAGTSSYFATNTFAGALAERINAGYDINVGEVVDEYINEVVGYAGETGGLTKFYIAAIIMQTLEESGAISETEKMEIYKKYNW